MRNRSSLKAIIDGNRVGLGTLEGNLLSAARGRQVRSLYVTSARPGEGTTVTAASLAYGLSIHGKEPVVLLEGNLTNPCFGDLFEIDPERPCLVDYLLSRADWKAVSQPTEFRNLMVIPSIAETPGVDWRRAFSDAVFAAKLSELQASYRYVVFDGEAVFASSLPSIQARFFDGVVLTVECRRTKWEVVNLARDRLTDAGATILGVVLNKRDYAIPHGVYAKV